MEIPEEGWWWLIRRIPSPGEIHSLREKLRLSQEGMGRLIGVCFQTVYLWEKGLVVPGPYRESTKRLMSLIEEYGSWEEDPLFNQETERISIWQRRMLKKSPRLREKEKRNDILLDH